MAELIHQNPHRSFNMDITYEIKHHAHNNAASTGKKSNAHAFSLQKDSLTCSCYRSVFFCFFVSVE